METHERAQNERGVGLLTSEEVAEVSKTIAPQAAPASEPGTPERIEPEEETDEESLEEESDLSYEEGLVDGLELNTDFVDQNQETILKKREDTRSRLAIAYLIATFVVFIISMAIAVLDGILRNVSIIDNLKEIVPLISGVFLGSLGFVLGYYFRQNEDEDQNP